MIAYRYISDLEKYHNISFFEKDRPFRNELIQGKPMTDQEMRNWVIITNQIKWRSAKEIDENARELIDEHLIRIKNVIEFLKTKDFPTLEAYDRALSGGDNDDNYDVLIDSFFELGEFKNAGVREHLIFVLTSCFFWKSDEILNDLKNPWEPLFSLYKLGFTTSFESNEEEDTIDLLVGSSGEIAKFKII